MTDLELTKLAAEAMGFGFIDGYAYGVGSPDDRKYDPLHNDAQAMALVKRFEISIAWSWAGQVGCMAKEEAQQAIRSATNHIISCVHKDLNRAIVECVAKMQASVSSQDNASTK